MVRKIFGWLAPSTRAASIRSPGSCEMKLCSRNTASGRAKQVCANHTWANFCSSTRSQAGIRVTPPRVTPVEKNFSSGTSAICSGTICNAKIAM